MLFVAHPHSAWCPLLSSGSLCRCFDSELTHNSDENEDKLAVARAIFKEGLLMVVDDALGVNKSSNSDEDEDDDGIF